MTIRPHNAQHDAIADLPLVTRSAVVTDVTTMDRDRRRAVRRTLAELLDDRGLADRYRELIERPGRWGRLREALAADGRVEVARRVAVLEERHDRPFPMLTRVRFRTDERLEYVAGQYVGVRYGGHSRAYSLASSPNRELLEICVRRSPGGRLSPRICEDLVVGDTVTLRGPHGDLVLGPPSERDLVFAATGTGVAPFKAMIDYAFEEGLDRYDGATRDVWLFLGAGWEDDLPYRREWRSLADERENFHFVPTLSRESYLTDWRGETDYVQDVLAKYVDADAVTTPLGTRLERRIRRSPDGEVSARIDPATAEAYVCGLNAMVHSTAGTLRRLGVPDRYVASEGFG